ncbi:MAG: glutamate racemase [Verrucomicrobiota bacterium]
MNDHPIGIFDSGVGGLTVLRAVRSALPSESLVYLGDTARVPYGNKSPATVARYALEDSRFLLGKGVKMIVIACNTASALAAPALRSEFPGVPILGMIGPGSRAATRTTRNGRIGVIATAATIGSGAYEQRIRATFAADGREPELIRSVACPLFVPLAEEGETDSEIARLAAAKYLAPLKADRIDTLVLGCTHYPLLRRVIAETMGPEVTLVDSAEAAAAETATLLGTSGLLCSSNQPARSESFFVTDATNRFATIASAILGSPPASLELVSLGAC